ncbi:transcriptional regulator UhpA [Photobacterium andalusiense]|uniref:Transcriptional regulatory protein UhpA n=1 Tax=Photobacterium andalusiense TaxID=2204296 RepID=A0A1Y6M7J3_9GAMM|nr:transcriptional regulator UhpA [Photobacterium andalusiense]SMY32512.1 Transcriptional regulatory protein UhpA [Photobacterium andalusiense]
MITVALVDDHVIVRSGFAQLLSLESDIKVVSQFSSAQEARDGLAKHAVDVCIIDISMPNESGLTLLEDLSRDMACIMLSVHDTATVVNKALTTGAKGYLSKRCSPDELIQAVRKVAIGQSYLASDITTQLGNIDPYQQSVACLTKRERQISEMLATGLDVKEVAIELGLSHKTVHVHRANAMDKLNVNNNVELAKYFPQEVL